MSGIATTVNAAKAIAKGVKKAVSSNSRPGNDANRRSTSDSQVSNGPVIEGQRRANAIDDIVSASQKSGAREQSRYTRNPR